MQSRRNLLQNLLFGTGGVGLRALATGLPAAFFTRGARADDAGDRRPQFLILSTSPSGDPINANAPGTYDDARVIHPREPELAATTLHLGETTVRAARVWTRLPERVRNRASFFHHATFTNNHPNLPKVLRLMGATKQQEMLPSAFAKALAPRLGTVQTEPVSIGAGDLLSFAGRSLPPLAPLALRDLLARDDSPLARLTELRARTLDEVHALVRERGTRAERAYLDRLSLSHRQARALGDSVRDLVRTIDGDDTHHQITAAVALVKMKVTPVAAIRISFGGDNHSDQDLSRREAPDHVSGVDHLVRLFALLDEHRLADDVTFASINVFGRTLRREGWKGRDHSANHHVTVMVGAHVRAGVIGGIVPRGDDYSAQDIDARTGRATPGGDVPLAESLSAMGKTLGAALGVPKDAVDAAVMGGREVTAALA